MRLAVRSLGEAGASGSLGVMDFSQLMFRFGSEGKMGRWEWERGSVDVLEVN